jgi:hypothetical protein
VRAEVPDVEWEQLWVSHAADDDGLWFFRRRGQQWWTVQIESSTGNCPFLIEGNGDGERLDGVTTPAEVARIVVSWLGEGGLESSPG